MESEIIHESDRQTDRTKWSLVPNFKTGRCTLHAFTRRMINKKERVS